MKAILETDRPENCYKECEFAGASNICHILSERNRRDKSVPVEKTLAFVPRKGRREDCPLKLMPDNPSQFSGQEGWE